MTVKRDPNAVQVNGALIFVRDPNAASASLYSKWRRVDGLASVTLPAEAGSATETALMDGSVSFANPAGAGNISGAIGALNPGPIHQYLENKARLGDQMQFSIIRPASNVETLFNLGSTAFEIVGDTAAERNRIKIPTSHQPEVKRSVRSGMIVTVDADSAEGAATIPTSVANFLNTSVVASNALWQGVMEVGEDGEWVDVAPGFHGSSSISSTANMGEIVFRNPGRSYINVTGTMNQWDRGDYQTGGAITSNFQIVPSVSLPTVTVEHRLESEFTYTSDGGWTLA